MPITQQRLWHLQGPAGPIQVFILERIGGSAAMRVYQGDLSGPHQDYGPAEALSHLQSSGVPDADIAAIRTGLQFCGWPV
ncbi:MAG: hypothetical protein KKA73_18560 [Chloroflexi bacterium]|nr:hypothetical protein [Chloroflexota bacterium]MBU1749691.1 hypothetical protein [Chloroflexota bacterium]